MRKRALAIIFAAALATGMVGAAGCGSSDSGETTGTAAETQAAVSDGQVYNIGICQLVQHEALDAATEGFEDAITEALGAENVNFDYQNASGDSANCATIVNGFVSDGVDLILANATAPLQAATAATSEIPILGTSVTDYATALELGDDFDGTIGTNVSGCSDLAPLDEQAAAIKELFPDATNVGILYCTAEPNSVYQANVITGYLEDEGYTVSVFTFTDTNDVASVAQDAADNCDVIYIPTDNTAAANTEAIANVVIPAGVPVFAGEEGIATGCGVATLSISYYDLGYATGEMAVKILTGEADVSEMPIGTAGTVTKKYNAANCDALGITVPDDYVAIETEE